MSEDTESVKTESRRTITKTQIVLAKSIYEKNIKKHFRNVKNELLKEKDALIPILTKRKHEEIKSNISRMFPEIENVEVTSDRYGDNFININNNVSKYNDYFRTLIKDEPYISSTISSTISTNDLRSLVSIKFNKSISFPNEPEMIIINKKLHDNCKAYNMVMLEVGNWEIEAVNNMHTGKLHTLDIKAAQPVECPM